MKSIERTFITIKEKNPYWGSYIIFAETVKQTHPNYRILKLWFNKLVDKTDYSSSEKTQLLAHLKSLITPLTMYELPKDFARLTHKRMERSIPSL